MIGVLVDMKSRRGEIFERDSILAVEVERNGLIFLAVGSGSKVEIIKRERVVVVEAEDNVLAVACRVLCRHESSRSRPGCG